MDCYGIGREDLVRRCPFPVRVVADVAAVHAAAARIAADLILENHRADRDTAFILPVGPLHYAPWAELMNRERIPLARTTLFMMDEYLEPDGRPVATTHPLSFRRFMEDQFASRVDPALGFSPDRIRFPLPDRLAEVSRLLLDRGGADLCFAGVGISGHLAFNDPPEPHERGTGDNAVRGSTARVVTINRESTTQMAIGGTRGNWSIIPRTAVTLGMKEILASRRIVLLGMRSWHAGTVRRALFGPVGRECPASFLQEHSRVEVILTELAAGPPAVNVTLDTGEEGQE